LLRFSDYPARNLDAALTKEWLETNGIGGFSSSTIVGLNTRRYHGLLTAATHPPVGRVVLLSKLEETIIVSDARTEISCNEYSGAIHPTGHQYLSEFRLDPFPVFVYSIGEVALEKSVFLVQGENTVVVEYKSNEACALEIQPLIAFRDYHSLTRANGVISSVVQFDTGSAVVHPYLDLPQLYFAHNASEFRQTGSWYYNFRYRVEQERGLDSEEDLFNPFLLRFELDRFRRACIVVSVHPRGVQELDFLRSREVQRRSQISARCPSPDSFEADLTAAAEQFIVARGNLQTIIAGYHWFSDWGRDTMIGLPGLAISTGRFDVAKNILLAFANAVDMGMVPNRWPDAGVEPEYNTADATLWFFEAIGKLVRRTGDYQFLADHLLDKLTSIIDWHVRGTRFGIRMAANGLLSCGETGADPKFATQLTWMDARCGDAAVTPRVGMPVEIEALWYTALCWMEHFSANLGNQAQAEYYNAMASTAKHAFEPLFWNEEAKCLYDVVEGDVRDPSIRPNQIFAISLSHPLLAGERARQVVERVQQDLLTPVGLRSLAPSDSRYAGRYEGGPSTRDSRYHQGTVWSWLLGPFITAYLRVNEDGAAARQQASEWLNAIKQHLQEAGLGQISEIFDGDFPHNPRGCIAQAWSVGEVLRVVSDLKHQQTA
jgi:predicted glycogen debranching enzyme